MKFLILLTFIFFIIVILYNFLIKREHFESDLGLSLAKSLVENEKDELGKSLANTLGKNEDNELGEELAYTLEKDKNKVEDTQTTKSLDKNENNVYTSSFSLSLAKALSINTEKAKKSQLLLEKEKLKAKELAEKAAKEKEKLRLAEIAKNKKLIEIENEKLRLAEIAKNKKLIEIENEKLRLIQLKAKQAREKARQIQIKLSIEKAEKLRLEKLNEYNKNLKKSKEQNINKLINQNAPLAIQSQVSNLLNIQEDEEENLSNNLTSTDFHNKFETKIKPKVSKKKSDKIVLENKKVLPINNYNNDIINEDLTTILIPDNEETNELEIIDDIDNIDNEINNDIDEIDIDNLDLNKIDSLKIDNIDLNTDDVVLSDLNINTSLLNKKQIETIKKIKKIKENKFLKKLKKGGSDVNSFLLKDKLLNKINNLRSKIHVDYHPNEVSQYGGKLNFIKTQLHKPYSYNFNNNKLEQEEYELIPDMKYKFLIENSEHSLENRGLNRWELLNPENDRFILPKIIFSYQTDTDKRVIDFDKFKSNILDKIKKYKSVNENKFKELDNSKLSIWEKNKLTEVPYNKFYKIIELQKMLLDKYFYDFIKDPKNKKQVKCLKPEKINCRTKIIRPQIYKILQSKSWFKFIFRFNYYINNKVFAYTLFSKTFINKKNNEIKIQALTLMGLLHEQDIYLNNSNNSKNYILDDKVEIYRNSFKNNVNDFALYDTDKGYLYSDSEKNIIAEKKQQKEILSKLNNNRKQNLVKSYCIGGIGMNKTECESSENSLGIPKIKGTWDSKCIKNSDCPFYGKNGNLNYPNNRGGCINGICELPLNLNQIGPRTYINKPICHNCPISKK